MANDQAAEIIDLRGTRRGRIGESAGDFLKNARLAAGIDLDHVAGATKIRREHLDAIEERNFDALPTASFAVGFARVYAGYLGLDADAIAAQFRADIMAAREASAPPAPIDDETEARAATKIVSLAVILVILIFVGWIVLRMAGAPAQRNAADDERPRIRVEQGDADAAPRPVLGSLTRVPNSPGAASEDVSAPADSSPVADAVPVAAPAAPGLIVEPLIETTVAPIYPEACRAGAARVERVQLAFDVTATGAVRSPRVVSASNPCFADAAIAAAAQWRYAPRRIDGEAYPASDIRASLNFSK